MAEFIETIINNLPQGYQRALEEVSQRRDLRDTDLDMDALVESILERAQRSSFSPLFSQIEFVPGSTIQAADFQQMIVEAWVDLKALYQQNNRIDAFGGRFYEITNSTQNNIKKTLLRLNEIVGALLARKRNPTFNEIKILSFQQATNYYELPEKADIDSETGLVGGRPVIIKRFAQRRGPLRPVLTAELLTSGLPGNAIRTFDPEKAVSADPRNFWMDIILSERLITSTYNSVSLNGPIVEFTVRFPQAEIVNQVKLKQLSRFPMKLLDMRYRLGDQVFSFPGFNANNLTDDLTEINFEATRLNEIRFVLLQEGWRELNIHIPKQTVHQQEVLDKLFQRSSDAVINRDEVDFGRVNEALRILDETNSIDPEDLREATRQVFVKLTEDTDLLIKATRLVGDSNTKDPEEEIVELQRYEYQFGLQFIEVNNVQYTPQATFASERLRASGSPFVFALETDQTDVTLVGDPDARLVNESEIRYEIEISPRRSFPMLPEGTTEIVGERLSFNQETRVAKTRFSHKSVGVKLYRNGLIVAPGSYTTGTGTNKDEITISDVYTEFAPNAIFVASYDLLTTFETVDITELFDSIKPEQDEVHPGTDENNQVELERLPFILLDAIHDTERWLKRDPREARYLYVPRQGTDTFQAALPEHDPPVVQLDGEFFGKYTSILSADITAAATVIDFTTDIPPTGLIQIEEELITYTRDVSNTKRANAVRGVRGTTAAVHVGVLTTTWIAESFYEPITVTINGVRARNLTDYEKGEHNAFQPAQSEGGTHAYVQIGRRLYFDTRITGNISVDYRRMADYVRLRAVFNSNSSKERFYSTKLSTAIIKMKSAVT